MERIEQGSGLLGGIAHLGPALTGVQMFDFSRETTVLSCPGDRRDSAQRSSRHAADLAVWAARRLAAAAHDGDPLAAERRVRLAHQALGVELSGCGLPVLVRLVTHCLLPGWRFAAPGWLWPTAHECTLLELIGRVQAGESAAATTLLGRYRCRFPASVILECARYYAADLSLGGLLVPATVRRRHGLRVVQ